jgi:DivIVA domain-containing protein
VRLDPGDDLDPSLVYRLEPLSLLLGILVWDGADEVVTPAVLIYLARVPLDDDLVHQHLGERAPINSRQGYATAEVDAFRKALRDTFLGVRPPSLTWDEAHDKQFTPTRLRPGYKVEQVDAVVDKAEQRLAAMRSDVVRRALMRYVARS